jgi:pyruvate dehydrogenase E2 component (dihydrolipoamide acetyltransferase)
MAEKVLMPKLGFDMAEGVLIRWIKMEGDAVVKGDVLAEIETDKATVEVESQLDGQLLKQLVKQDAIVPVGAPIAVIGKTGESVEIPDSAGVVKAPVQDKQVEKTETKSAEAAAEPVLVEGERIKISPLAKKMAEESNLPLTGLSGTGPGGRILKADVEKRLSEGTPVMASSPAVRSAAAAGPMPVVNREDKKVPVNKLRQIIGRRLVESKQQIPHFYLSRAYQVDGLMKMRAEINQLLPAAEKLSVNDFIVKAVALTLVEFPNLNASLIGNEIVLHGNINIGNAVAVEGGLMTVVTRDAHLKSIRSISAETKGMVQRARDGKVKTEDIEGSTFSISNLGMYKIDHFAAIINPPEAAILAVGAAQQVPVVQENTLGITWMMNMTISADHRITDGAEAAEFMLRLEYYIQNPLMLLV